MVIPSYGYQSSRESKLALRSLSGENCPNFTTGVVTAQGTSYVLQIAGEGGSKLSISVFHDISRKRNSSGELKLLNNNNSMLTLWFNEQVLINEKPASPNDAIPTPSEWSMTRVK